MNEDARSGDYDSLQTLFRPGHADFTYFMKYGLPPQPGGGRASGRETVGRVAAGAIARLLLERHGISVLSHTLSVGAVIAQRVEPGFADRNPLRCPDPDVAHLMEEAVDAARADRDSLGGVVEVVIDGSPPGLGEPVADKLDALLGSAFFSIGAVKGVEFGDGFALARMRGSHSNDPMASTGFLSNKAGGILGGISTGQPIVARLAVKPTPSIGKPQQTTDLDGMNATIEIAGRHDPCICPRIGPVAEAMAALVIADCLTANRARKDPGT
jgi:chorismate synthase